MFNFRQQDSECLLTPEAVVQIKLKLRKRRAENGQKQPLELRINCQSAQRPARPYKVLGLRLSFTEPGVKAKQDLADQQNAEIDCADPEVQSCTLDQKPRHCHT